MMVEKKKILCLGNEFINEDSFAKSISKELSVELGDFVFVNINDSFELMNYLQLEKNLIILDVVRELHDVKLISINDLKSDSITTAHDFDASFFLQLLGSGDNIRIIGIPQSGDKKKILGDVKKFLV